jgi:hypothetical protein
MRRNVQGNFPPTLVSVSVVLSEGEKEEESVSCIVINLISGSCPAG